MRTYDVVVGVDVGKSFHHLYAIGKGGEELVSKQVIQCEQTLVDTFKEFAASGSTLIVVDQPNNIGSLTIACARTAGCDVAYLPGLAMRRAAGIIPGEAKTDARDAYVIALTAYSMPLSLRPVTRQEKLRADLLALASYDDDCRCDMTREKNRLRAHLIEVHPVFERAFGDDIDSPFVMGLLMKFGGPWSIKDNAGRVKRWIKTQKRVPQALLARLMNSLDEMHAVPEGSALREEIAIPSCARRIAELKECRKQTQTRMEALLEGDAIYEALQTMPGVGTKTAVALIIHVDIDAFESADHLASYAGIAPRTFQSGTSIKGEGAARIGNRALKSALFLSAFASLRTEGLSRDYYDKKRAEGKRHNMAVISLARKRLKVMYAIMRDKTPYRAVT
jgi:transposase